MAKKKNMPQFQSSSIFFGAGPLAHCCTDKAVNGRFCKVLRVVFSPVKENLNQFGPGDNMVGTDKIGNLW